MNCKNCINTSNNCIEDIDIEKYEEIQYYDELLFNLESFLTSEYYNTSSLDKGKAFVLNLPKVKIELATTKSETDKINENLTSIYLGHCETLLRDFYFKNKSDDKLLYIKKLEIFQEGMKIPKIE